MKIEIKNKFTGNVIFSYNAENNSISRTVKAALKQKINLSNADLYSANLSNADLSDANFRWCVGDGKIILSMQVTQWGIAFTKTHLAIRCKQYSIEEWRNFNDDEISKMNYGALEWWKKWKDFIFQAIELSK